MLGVTTCGESAAPRRSLVLPWCITKGKPAAPSRACHAGSASALQTSSVPPRAPPPPPPPASVSHVASCLPAG